MPLFLRRRPRPFVGYATVLGTRGVLVPVLGTALASLPIGVLGLAVLLATERSTGVFTTAGLIGALLGVGTGIGIAVQGRLMDRFGHPRVLLGSAAIQAVALVGLVAAIRGDAAVWLTGTAAFVAGLGEPQVGGCLRALWPTLVAPEHRQAAMALSSITFELPVVSGPLIFAAALLVVPVETVVLLAGAAFLGGAAVLAGSRAAGNWTPTRNRPTGILGPLVSARLRRVLVVALVQGVVTGLLQMSCAAFAARGGATATAGVLYAALSVGSLLGTVAYGANRRVGSPRPHIAALTGPLALALVGASVASGTTVLGIWVLVAGLALGPIAVCCFAEAEAAAPAGTHVSAFTSLTAGGLAGAACGTALAGLLVDVAPPPVALLLAAALTVVATVAVTMPVAE